MPGLASNARRRAAPVFSTFISGPRCLWKKSIQYIFRAPGQAYRVCMPAHTRPRGDRVAPYAGQKTSLFFSALRSAYIDFIAEAGTASDVRNRAWRQRMAEIVK